ncbi:MAG: MFS transporter [Bacteroidetes bacterium]|nr:MFS transporter [Bacteroidota bacterium]
MKPVPNANKQSLIPIFITVFIDMLGVGIIIPVIPALFFEADGGFFGADFPEARISILYGYLLACYPIMQFFGAPLLGALSDRHGRKPLITISLIGTMVGYLLFAVAILQQNILLLFLSRMLPGFTGGNISIIYSAISDVSDDQKRTANFGLVGMAFGLGFILGPALGGVLADETIVSWFNPTTPFWFTAILTFGNILLVQFRFRETLKEKQTAERKLSLFSGFRNVGRSFAAPHLRNIFAVVLVLSLGFTFFTQYFSVRLIQKFDYTESNIGFLYGWIGIWLVITQGVFVRILSRRVSSQRILTISTLALGIALGLILIPENDFWFYVINPLIAISQGITQPNLTSVVAAQAKATEQGEILGINQSMRSLGQAVPPILAGYLYTLNSNLPLMAAAGFTFVGWLIYMVFFRKA